MEKINTDSKQRTTLVARGNFFRSEVAIVSGEAVIEILASETKKPSGRGSYKPQFHANLF